MQMMPILVADKSALQKGKDGELAALRVRAFRMLVEILPQAYPDHASNCRFPKIHMIVHLLDNVIMRRMLHHYSMEMWEHTHKGTVKILVRGSNWKDIPRRIFEEEVQKEIYREVAQDAGGGRQYATALREVSQCVGGFTVLLFLHFDLSQLDTPRSRCMGQSYSLYTLACPPRQAVETMKLVLTRKGRTMRPEVEGDAVMSTYRTALGELMDSLLGCMVAANITASEIVVREAHTAVAIPRTKGGALVSKGAFIKASPNENWFTDFAVKSNKMKEEWYAKALCIFKAVTAEGERRGFVYMRWYEQGGGLPTHHMRAAHIVPVGHQACCGCTGEHRADSAHLPLFQQPTVLEALKAPPEKVFAFTEFPLIPTRVPLGVSQDEHGQVSREWHMPLFTQYIDDFNAELHAKNEKAVVVVHNPAHVLTGCVKRTRHVAGFVVDELTRVRVVQTFGVVPACAFTAINGVVDALKAVFRTWFMRNAVSSTEWIRYGVFPRPPLHDVLYKLFMAGKLTMPGTIQRSWWRAGCVPKGWLARMDCLKGKAAGMFKCLVLDLTHLQLVIEEFKSKCSSRAFMTAWDFVGCDEDLLEKWMPVGAGDSGPGEEIPAYFCIPEGPLMRESRICRRVGRMVHGGFVMEAERLGIHPRNVPKEVGVVNEEVVSRLRRTPTKRTRGGSTSSEGVTSDGSEEEAHVQAARVLFPVEDDKDSVVRVV
ncbi:unnamed protein product [Closterium sp. NIES-64]|nr:unnamed protein product [Closterium sp. NIES-64]